jgi:hypothetical protein
VPFFVLSILLLKLDLPDTNRSYAASTKSTLNTIIFSPPVAPSEEAIEAGEVGEEELDELEEILTIKSARTSRRKCVV